MCLSHGCHVIVFLSPPFAGQDSWSSVQNIVNYYITNQDVFAFAAGPGHWNDPDMVR